MSQFDSILTTAKNEGYQSKKQTLERLLITLQTMQQENKPLTEQDKKTLLDFAYGQVDVFLDALPGAASYREKDLIFECEDLLIGLIMSLCPNSMEVPRDVFAKIKQLAQAVTSERKIENCLDKLFRQENITGGDAETLLDLIRQTDDEYQKGKLYLGLLHYKDSLSKLSVKAKAHISGHITQEIQRYLSLEHLTDDAVNSLEVAADISKHFADDALLAQLQELLKLGRSNINYYAAETLLTAGQDVPAHTLLALAQDPGYAAPTRSMLEALGKGELFPQV